MLHIYVTSVTRTKWVTGALKSDYLLNERQTLYNVFICNTCQMPCVLKQVQAPFFSKAVFTLYHLAEARPQCAAGRQHGVEVAFEQSEDYLLKVLHGRDWAIFRLYFHPQLLSSPEGNGFCWAVADPSIVAQTWRNSLSLSLGTGKHIHKTISLESVNKEQCWSATRGLSKPDAAGCTSPVAKGAPGRDPLFAQDCCVI